MLNIGSTKLDKTISAASIFLGFPLVAIYLTAMIIYPLISGNWEHVQSVWDRWQSLNVGILAFASSVIAFNISIFNARRQKEREFIAAKAFLPEALSHLCSYAISCSSLLKEAWGKVEANDTKSNLNTQAPNLPAEYKEIFSKCISLAPPLIGDHLVQILIKLQINHARMLGLFNEFNEQSTMVVTERNIHSYMYELGELYALINAIFDVARGTEEFSPTKVSLADITTAYLNLGFLPHGFGNLSEFTKRAINLSH